MPFVNITGPILGTTIYINNTLVAKDAAVTLPEVTPITADIQAMGTMSLPMWQLLEDMELAITKIGIDKGMSKMLKPEALAVEIRWAQPDIDANASQKNVGCKAFIKAIPKIIPGTEFAVGEATENEVTMMVTRYQVFVNGEELWLIDRLAGIVRVDGSDYSSGVNSLL